MSLPPWALAGAEIGRSFFVYMLECADHTYHVGRTNNLETRLRQQNGSKHGAHYTKLRRPVVLQHGEVSSTLKEAGGREAEIKQWKRAKKEQLVKTTLVGRFLFLRCIITDAN